MTVARDQSDKRIHNRLRVAREGFPFIGAGVVLTAFLLGWGFGVAGAAMCILTLFTVYFFRDPERRQEAHNSMVLAPADGRILDIQMMAGEDNLLGEPAVKLSIFMSIFNVHVNRIPARGKILRITYHPGRFLAANLDKASEKNEHNRITLETEGGERMVIVQIAGLIARRIACWVKEGDEVTAGQRLGLIRFGSRVDIYLPQRIRLLAERAHRVRAGETILGYLS